MTKGARMSEYLEHAPAEPMTIGQAVGLIYCMRCGFLLSSETNGQTRRFSKPCEPVPVGYRA